MTLPLLPAYIGTPAVNQLYCMDALKFLRTIPPDSIDFIFTDPPYGHNNNNQDLIHRWEVALGQTKTLQQSRAIENDGQEANDLFRECLKEYRRILKPGACCCCCCCGGGGPDPQFARWSLWMDEALDFKQMVVWDKGKMGMGWHYRRSYETILVAQKPGAACKWYDTTNKVENIIRDIPKIIPQSHQHPTEKPIRLARHFIQLHTEPGDVVLDPFAGGGSTLIAAKELRRAFMGCEIDQRFVSLAWQKLNKTYTRISDLPLFQLR